jgi:hypothetical protein
MTQATLSKELFGKFTKESSQIEKEIMKLPRFFENLGRFLPFFFGNYHI